MFGASITCLGLELLATRMLAFFLGNVGSFLAIPIALLSIGPLGVALGAFYPVGVERLARAGRADAVPMTCGLATLPSVLGSTWAMVAVVNQGFRVVLLEGVAGYAVLAAAGFAGARAAAGAARRAA